VKENRQLNQFLLIAGMLGVLALAFVFDRVLQAQVNNNPTLLQINTTIVWLIPLFELLTMLAVVGLVWMMITSGGYARWVSAVFLVVGIVLLYLTAVMVVVPFPEKMYILMDYLTIQTYLFQASGAIAAVGFVSLWFWKAEPAPDTEEDSEPLADESEPLPEGSEQ
jgi:hypothetical protein